MRKSAFHYHLPPERIAQEPPAERSAGRLLLLPRAGGAWEDRQVRDLPRLLAPGDLLVFNDTRVIPARLFGRKETGGRVELLVERVLDERTLLAQVRASKAPRSGSRLHLGGDLALAEVQGREAELYRLRLVAGPPAMELLERAGHVPLPPYIRRPDRPEDRHRYQTLFAREPGSVAAPTASLHFDRPLLAALAARGIETTSLTLHVGAGTFAPVRTERIEDHRMHAERYAVPEAACRAVAAARARGGRVVAVGTTVVRSLEMAGRDGELQPARGETRLFITPGHRFRVVDGLLTNFHLPESTLLMLVCAFAGRERVLAAYAHAVQAGYRFFSYGDAMLIL